MVGFVTHRIRTHCCGMLRSPRSCSRSRRCVCLAPRAVALGHVLALCCIARALRTRSACVCHLSPALPISHHHSLRFPHCPCLHCPSALLIITLSFTVFGEVSPPSGLPMIRGEKTTTHVIASAGRVRLRQSWAQPRRPDCDAHGWSDPDWFSPDAAAPDAASVVAAAAAVRERPSSSHAWCEYAKALIECGRFLDAVHALSGETTARSSNAAKLAAVAQERLQHSITQMVSLSQATNDRNAAPAEVLDAWRRLAAADPTSLHARSQVLSAEVQSAVRARDAAAGDGARERGAAAMAEAVLLRLRAAARDLQAYRASTGQPIGSGLALLHQRRPNLAVTGHTTSASVMASIEAIVELNLGVAIDLAASALPAATRVRAVRQAARHFERAADVSGGKGEHAFNIFSLWGAAVERDPHAGPLAARRVYERGVAAGVWVRAEQRPAELLRELDGAPWHQPSHHPACRVLIEHFEAIRAEGIALLEADDRGASADAAAASDRGESTGAGGDRSRAFRPYTSKALQCGEWADVVQTTRDGSTPPPHPPQELMCTVTSTCTGSAHVQGANVCMCMCTCMCNAHVCVRPNLPLCAGPCFPLERPAGCRHAVVSAWTQGLYFNGCVNRTAAQRAPTTTRLLGSDCSALRRDATSCSLGSAYFSLLRPHTRLKPHCGPTNARLRAHLGLRVPPGDCAIRCGDTPPRRWVEGEVLLFDDSFEARAAPDRTSPAATEIQPTRRHRSNFARRHRDRTPNLTSQGEGCIFQGPTDPAVPISRCAARGVESDRRAAACADRRLVASAAANGRAAHRCDARATAGS